MADGSSIPPQEPEVTHTDGAQGPPFLATTPTAPLLTPAAPFSADGDTGKTPEATPALATMVAKPDNKSKLPWLILSLIVLLIAAGCYAFATQRSGGSQAKTAVQATVVKKDIPELKIVSAVSGWESFYPNIVSSGNYHDTNSQIFEGLVSVGSDNRVTPMLATGWTNPDDSTWIFTLKKGVKFHSGREMTAQDVVDSFVQAKESDLGQIYATTIKSVTATEPFKVTIKTDGSDPILLNKLANYYVYDTKSGKTADPLNGTGPYTIKPGTTADAASLELVAFDAYHRGRPHVRAVIFKGLAEDDFGSAYESGKANAELLIAVQPSVVKKPYSSNKIESLGIFVLHLNTLKAGSPLQNIKVRQAISLAVDPLAVAKVRSDSGLPAAQIVPSTIPGFDPSLKRAPRDVAKAKKLLAEAGYTNGVTLQFTYYAPAEQTAQEIKKELAEAGINLTLDPQAEVKVLAKKALGGGTDMYFNTQISEVLDASDVLMGAVDNPNYKNPQAIAYLKQAGSTLNTDKRLVFLKQASRALSEDAGIIPVYSADNYGMLVYNPAFVIPKSANHSSLNAILFEAYAK